MQHSKFGEVARDKMKQGGCCKGGYPLQPLLLMARAVGTVAA